jgi:hypothetical protein
LCDLSFLLTGYVEAERFHYRIMEARPEFLYKL